MEDEDLNLTFAALADPTRRAILARLARGEATVNVLAGPFPMSLQAVSRHLKVLEGAGLITRSRDAQFRPCALREPMLEQAAVWITQVREAWRQDMSVAEPQGGPEKTPANPAPQAPAFAALGDRAR